MSPSTQQLRQQVKRTQDKKKEVRPDFPAWIGHSDGVTINVDGRPLYVWVRTHQVNGRLMQAYNREVLNRFDQPVRVGYLDDTPNRLEVLSLNTEALPPIAGGLANSAQLATHALQHDLAGGDTDWIQSKRLTPFRPRPQTTADMTIFVEAGTYPFGSVFNRWDGGPSSDMTAHIPSTAGNALYRLVYIDGATNVLAYVNTAEFAADPFISRSATIAAAIPIGALPIAAVYLFNGQTTIDEEEIFDIRILFSPSPGSVAGGGGSGVLWANVLIVATSGGDHTTIGAALTASSSGDLILVAPGTYAENLTGKAGVNVRAMGQSQTVVIAPASGVPLTLPASGTVIFEQVRITPPNAEVGISFPSASTVSLLLHDSFVDADAAASIDASIAGATGKLTIRDSVIEGDVNTKAITELHEVTIQGDLNQSASAGNLTIFGGVIETDFAHITGSTIKLIDLPKIDGTISGTGTITGPYITSTGAATFPQAVTISTLTATRVPFAGAAGLLTDDANFVFTVGTGELALATSGVGAGLLLGGDAKLYRVSADVLRTPDSLTVDQDLEITSGDINIAAGVLKVAGTERINNSGGTLFTSIIDSALTTTRVVFATTNGELTDSANFVFTTGTGQLALATTGSGGGLLIGGDTQLYRSAADELTIPDIFVVLNDGSSGQAFVDTYRDAVAGSIFHGRRARGSVATPAVVETNDTLLSLGGRGYNGTSFANAVAMTFSAAEDFSGTNQGTFIGFQTTLKTTTTRAEKMRLLDSGRLAIGSITASGMLHVDQNSATGAIPVAYFDQADVSEEMFEFATTIGTGNAIEAIGAKSLTTTHFIKVTIPGALTRYFPVGTIA